MAGVTLIENIMANCKTVFTSNQEVLGTVDIKRGIFQGDSIITINVCDHYVQEGYLGVLQLDKIMNKEMNESIRNEYIRRVKLICKSNLNAGNFISGINAWAISVMRYSRGIVDWTKEELQDMDGKLER